MLDHKTTYPFLEEFFARGFGTLYVLRDSAFRLRDATSALALTRFFAERSVRLDVVPLPAPAGQRYLSKDDVLKVFHDDKRLRERLFAAGDNTEELKRWVDDLFTAAARSTPARAAARHRTPVGSEPAIAPRGPVLVLGRPTLFPQSLLRQLEDELVGSTALGARRTETQHIRGRFRMPDEPESEGAERTISDTYYNVTRRLGLSDDDSDFGVIRKVRGAFPTRTVLLAYGTSSLGTRAAAQVLTDDDQNEELRRRGTAAHFERHGEVEVLVEVKRRTPDGVDTALVLAGGAARDLPPRQVSIRVGPDVPLTPSASEAIQWLTASPVPTSDLLALGDLYTRVTETDARARDLPTDIEWFQVHAGHPEGALATRMIGGSEVRHAVDEIRKLVAQSPRAPILLVGPPGTGKELAARVAFEVVVEHVARDLATGRPRTTPVVLGAEYEPFNCAALPDTMAESSLFGIAEGAATSVVGSPGVILAAGEGVAFLDELSFLTPAQQGKLLRVFEDERVRPVGHPELPLTALIVAAMSDDPDDLVHAGKLLPALYGRFRGRVVRLPPLAHRVGDVPALLASFARRPVCLSEFALRGLLAGRYESNARDLQRIVGRAERRFEPASDNRMLEIDLDDYGAEQQVPRSLDWAHDVPGRRFGFFVDDVAVNAADVPQTLDFDIFRQFCRVLTALEVRQTLGLRPAEPAKLSPQELNLTFSDTGTAVRQWLHALKTLDDRHSAAWLEEYLPKCAGPLQEMRWSANEAQVFRIAVVKANGKAGMPMVNANRIAWSLGVHPSTIARDT